MGLLEVVVLDRRGEVVDGGEGVWRRRAARVLLVLEELRLVRLSGRPGQWRLRLVLVLRQGPLVRGHLLLVLAQSLGVGSRVDAAAGDAELGVRVAGELVPEAEVAGGALCLRDQK